jgi:hypothetical protein
MTFKQPMTCKAQNKRYLWNLYNRGVHPVAHVLNNIFYLILF